VAVVPLQRRPGSSRSLAPPRRRVWFPMRPAVRASPGTWRCPSVH